MADGRDREGRRPDIRRDMRTGRPLVPERDEWNDEDPHKNRKRYDRRDRSERRIYDDRRRDRADRGRRWDDVDDREDRRRFRGRGGREYRYRSGDRGGQEKRIYDDMDDRDDSRGFDERGDGDDRERFGQRDGRNGRQGFAERGGNNNKVGRERRDRPLVVGFRFLDNLQKREPADIVLTLSNPNTGFIEGLLQCVDKPYMIKMMLHVLAKAFKCNSKPEQLNRMYDIITKAEFFDTSMDYFLDMQNEDRVNIQASFREPIRDMITIMEELAQKNLMSATQFVGIHAVLEKLIDHLGVNAADNVIDDELLRTFHEFTKHRDKLVRSGTKSREDHDRPNGNVDEPPDDVGDIEIFPQTADMQGECKNILPCGHKCKSTSGKAHIECCNLTVDNSWSCGHTGKIKCHEKDDALCPAACDTILACEHRCRGTCGTCFQGRLHRPCQNDCIRILVCGHECSDKCNQCPPCIRKCENRCQHSKCNRRCGDLCVPCMELCTWRCEHFQCGRLCSEPCDRPRCDQPCMEMLTCGHQCIGLCGEPCPTDCRVCNQQEVTEILFGNEDEPHARFVLLEDCRARCIIESEAMDYYMDQNDEKDEIKLKACPKCKTPIRKSNRYKKIIALQDIEGVKKTVLMNKERILKIKSEIRDLIKKETSPSVRLLMEQRLNAIKEHKSENVFVAMQNQLTIVKEISKLEDEWKSYIVGIAFRSELDYALNILQHFHKWVLQERVIMTLQETSDAELEITRSNAFLNLLLHIQRAEEIGKNIDSELKEKIAEAKRLLKGNYRYEERIRITVEDCLKDLENVTKLSNLGISEKERLMVHKAMKLPSGHWYKCPKGHIYAIGECGGANQVGRCPDCNSDIGGTSHKLGEGNQVAGEMDGARFAAWSEQANLENYDPLDIRF